MITSETCNLFAGSLPRGERKLISLAIVLTNVQQRLADAAELAVYKELVRSMMSAQTDCLRALDVMLVLAENEFKSREAATDPVVRVSAATWRHAHLICSEAVKSGKAAHPIEDNPSLEVNQ